MQPVTYEDETLYERVSQNATYLDNYQVDIRLIPILMRMSRRGLLLRKAAMDSWHEELNRRMLFYQDICANEGFDPSKAQQVGYVLATRGNVLPLTKSQRQLKTDEETLEQLTDPLAQVVLGFRKAQKLQGTYIVPCLDKTRMYTNFRMDLATGRLASSDRNVQNIPPAVREIFAPDSGTWTWLDWSQLEMRLFAYITQDPVMLEAYASGSDVHTTTQMALWPNSDPKDSATRRRAKDFNFGMIFFASARTLSIQNKLPYDVAMRYRAEWLDRYREAYYWMKYQVEEGPNKGYADTIWGKKLKLPSIAEYHITHIQKCAVNYPVQGSAAGVVARAMDMLDDPPYQYDQAIQIHDEIVIDGDVDPPESLAHIHPDIYLPFDVKKSPVWT